MFEKYLSINPFLSQVLKTISDPAVKGYVPASWISLVHIKADYYRACSHYHISEALLTLPCSIKEEEHIGMRVREALQYFHLPPSNNTTTIDITVPSCRRERTILGMRRFPFMLSSATVRLEI